MGWFAIVVSVVAAACSYSAPPVSTADAAESPPTVGFEFTTSGGDEGPTEAGTTITVPVVLSKPSSQQITVKCTALMGGAGSAIETVDYTVITRDIVFAPGETRAEVSVKIAHDLDETEQEEDFKLALDQAEGAELDAVSAIHTVLIADHILPRISFTATTTTTTENTPTSLTVTLTAPSEGQSTVVVGITGGATSPADGDDITLANNTTITIPNGQTTATVAIGELDDTRDEPDTESLVFELKGASPNLVLGTDKTANHSIGDNDLPPVAGYLVAVADGVEGGTATVTVQLTAESELPITVDFVRRNGDDTAEGDDATLPVASVSFAPHTFGVTGETSKTFDISIADDTRDELVETVIVDLTTASNASVAPGSRYTLSIIEDANDTPSVTFSAATSTGNEGNNTRVIEVSLSEQSDKQVTVDFTVGGTATNGPEAESPDNDYLLGAGTVTFMPGQDQRNITVDIHDNDPPTDEGPETVILTLTNPASATLGLIVEHTLTLSE